MIGETIKTLRKQRHMTQNEFAKRLDVTQGAVSQWETGLTSPNSFQLQAIAQEFSVSVDYLLGLTHDPHGKQEVHVEKYQPTIEELVRIPEIAMMAREMGEMTDNQRAQMLAIGKALVKEYFPNEVDK